MNYENGTAVYILENYCKVRRATIVNRRGDFYTLRFDNGGGLRIRSNRLYQNMQEEETAITNREKLRIKDRILRMIIGYRNAYCNFVFNLV